MVLLSYYLFLSSIVTVYQIDDTELDCIYLSWPYSLFLAISINTDSIEKNFGIIGNNKVVADPESLVERSKNTQWIL